MNKIDLHVHTTGSDGTCSPAEVVGLAHEAGLSAIAITDHDTTSAWAEAMSEGARLGVEIVPGIEISAKYHGAVHILGYYPDPSSPPLRDFLAWIVSDRDERNEKVCARMAEDGLPVSYEEMKRRFGAIVGRPHFGQVLVELGLADSVQDAFDRYIERGRRYYFPRHDISAAEAVYLIREAGGVPVMAHPFQYRLDDLHLRALVMECVSHGLMGIECRYSGYSPEQSRYLESLADEYRLLKTGGSDFHGANKPHIRLGRGVDGTLDVPEVFFQKLKEAAHA